MAWDKEKKADYARRYQRGKVRLFALYVNREKDGELVEWMDAQESPSRYLRRLVWTDMVEKTA